MTLTGIICLVTGASRGIGRGIALGLGECGATVYITGRSVKSGDNTDVGGSLESTAAEINARGGKAIPVAVDHSNEQEIVQLFDRIRREQHGRLDLLVNNAYAAAPFMLKISDKAYYEIDDISPGEAWDLVNNVGLRNNYICCTLATRMMLAYDKQLRETGASHTGLIVNVSSVGAKRFLFTTAYGVGKCGIDRMTLDMSIELKRRQDPVSIISLWPGLVRTEQLMKGVEANPSNKVLALWSSNNTSESTELSGRVVAALLAESAPVKLSRSGQVVLVSDVAAEYGIREVDGSSPPHMRSLRTLLFFVGSSLAAFVPRFIRIPKSLFFYLLGRSQ